MSLGLSGYPISRDTFQKNPRAHKNKIGTSPPPQNPTPPKTRNFMDMGFPAERTQSFFFFSRRPWNWRSHFRPQNCGHEFYGHKAFSEPFNQQDASITWCDFFRPNFGQKTPEIISVHDVWEPWKQALLASRDVIISSQFAAQIWRGFFTLGDGCWLPI